MRAQLRRLYVLAAGQVAVAGVAVTLQLIDPEWWWLAVTTVSLLIAAWTVHSVLVLRRMVRPDEGDDTSR
ncbi:hypothetical protein ABZV93_17670 [Actinopolymorpha sp. NPDC004070]|uniref:hypothetical protein n=1 Tax=Actinopolymorpha sp. NPDC004070 TaxID=3154548 RepID=UPI0033B91598